MSGDRKVRKYERLGGAGLVRPLWECPRCGAAVSDRGNHDDGHEPWWRRCLQWLGLMAYPSDVRSPLPPAPVPAELEPAVGEEL